MRNVKRWLRRLLGFSAGFRWAFGCVVCSLLSWTAHASEGHGGGSPHVNWWTWDGHAPPVGWFFVNLFIFLALLVRFAGKPMAKSFAARHDNIKKAIDDADAAYKEAKEKFDDYNAKMTNIESEVAETMRRNREQGELERDRIIRGAQDESERLRKDAQRIEEHELSMARNRLKLQATRQAFSRAEEILTQTITAADRDRLLEQAIGELESSETPTAKTKRRSNSGRSAEEDMA